MMDSTKRRVSRWALRWTAMLALLYGATLGMSAAANEADKLVDLVRQGSIEPLAAYLAIPGADINARPDFDKALLDYAAEQNQVRVATWLLDHGANVNAQERTGFRKLTALHRAASFDSFEVAQLLIARGANVNADGAHGTTPLLFAAAAGRTRMVELLLRNGADPETSTPSGQTALSEAARKGYLDIVKLLGAHGATQGDDRALSEAALNQQMDVIRYLLDHNQSQDTRDRALRFAVIGADSRTDTASLDMVSLLIAAKANVNNTVQGAQNTPLMLAKRVELRELLLAHGALDLDALKTAQASQGELRDLLMTLGRARVLGPSLDIAAIRIMRKFAPTVGTADETSTGWQHLKDTIAQDLRYDVGAVLLVRADEIASRWQETLNSGLSADDGVALMGFFESDVGQRYLAFQSRLSSIQEAGMVAVATRSNAAAGHGSAQTQGELLEQRRRLIGLGWNSGTSGCCDDVLQWMATQGKPGASPDEIAAVAGPRLDALRTDYLRDLDAFATFQQTPASGAIAAARRQILDQTAAGTAGSTEVVATALQRSEQAHDAEWRQGYLTLHTATRPTSAMTVSSSRPPTVELSSCVKNPHRLESSAWVTGFPGERLYVSPKHPRECSDTGLDACPGTPYLLSGDPVQLQGTCDEWTRLSYKGARGTVVGWVTSLRLTTDSGLTPPPQVDPGSSKHEHPPKSTEAEVCRAAREGTVEDAGLRDVTRYSFPREYLVNSGEDMWGTPLVTAEGNVDLFNEGKPQRVVLMAVGYSNRGDDRHTEWPVVLNANGLPDRTIPTYQKVFESAGDSDHTRLFRFRGVTYMEHMPISESGTSPHEIWRFSRTEAVKVCDVK